MNKPKGHIERGTKIAGAIEYGNPDKSQVIRCLVNLNEDRESERIEIVFGEGLDIVRRKFNLTDAEAKALYQMLRGYFDYNLEEEHNRVREMERDHERLNFLQRITDPVQSGVVLRGSATGRGWRLHETSRSTEKDVRNAIDKGRERYEKDRHSF